MNQTDLSVTGPSWRQVSIQFSAWEAAEHTGVTHLGPILTATEAAGLVGSWFFIRKEPCWRLRFLPSENSTAQEATAFVHRRLDALRDADGIGPWVETIYEPETHAFGGSAAMDIAHHHQDSHHILTYLGSDRATASAGEGSQRRELSILLCNILMRAAGQDWYEQGDVWARVSEHRSLPPDAPLDRPRGMESDLRRLMTVDAGSLVTDNGPLAFVSDWAAAFDSAGTELGDLARNGNLRRGLRAVLTHHVIFAWNRIGLSYTTQSILANVAKTVVLGQ